MATILSTKKSTKIRRRISAYSIHASLAAVAPVIEDKQIFAPIHDGVNIPQKQVYYRPTDKLVFVTLGILSGSRTVYDINQTLRVDQPLLQAFGYETCADQSVIQETLNASTAANVVQLEQALDQVWAQHNLAGSLLEKAFKEAGVVTLDMDLSGQPCSKKAHQAQKGYFPSKKNTYGRQLARVLVPDTQEIVTEELYPGNITSCMVFKDMVTKMEHRLGLATKAQRRCVRLRLDGGFGTDENLNYALWRGYQILAKMFSGRRAKTLAKSVQQWVDIPTSTKDAFREAGWITTPHRYARKTRQIAVRMPKKKGGYAYSVLVTTDMDADLYTILQDYDDRGGIPESTFCQDYQGLGLRKRRKRDFVAQQMVILLAQLAHNLIRWIQHWMIQALEQSPPIKPPSPSKCTPLDLTSVVKTLQQRGMKRFVRQVLGLSGKVILKRGKVTRVILNPLYPLCDRIQTAFAALLEDYQIRVSLGKT